ncbi:MAG: hypothetical protein AAF288_14315 [Planctomycetota bacterium]
MAFPALLPALAVAMGLVGCGRTLTNPLLEPPTAKVVAVTPVERTPDAVRLVVTLRIENQANVELPLREASYTVRGPSGASRTTRARVFATAPPNGEQLIQLPASVRTPPTAATGTTEEPVYRASGTVTYEPPGEFRRLLTESAIPLPAVRFAGTGRESEGPGLLDSLDVLDVFSDDADARDTAESSPATDAVPATAPAE